LTGAHDPHFERPAPPEDAVAARLAAIVESSDDAIVGKDLNGVITSWNPAAERLFGYHAAEVIGKSIRIIIPEARQFEEDQVLRRIVRGEAVNHFETVRRRKDGTSVYVSLTISPIVNKAGTIIGASKIARDITQHIRARERSAFFGNMGPLLAASPEYETTLANLARLTTEAHSESAAAFADYSLIDIVGDDGRLRRVATAHRVRDKEPLLERARQYAPESAHSPLSRTLRTGQALLLARITELDFDRISGGPEHTELMRTLGAHSLITVPLTARDATFGLITFVRAERRDPYDREDLAFALEVAQRAALAVDNARLYTSSRQALQSREQVLAIVSHDFRNAVSAIATSTRLLLDAGGSEEQRRRRLQTILRVCDRMTRLVQDLLDVARLEAGHVLNVQPSENDAVLLLKEACESSRSQAEEKMLTLHCEFPGPLPPVWADRDRVLQVLSNLIGNAVKFTPEGGSITVRVEADAGMVQFSVADSGPGIRSEELDRIFDRFWQSARTASLGTGLGLPIAKGIVEAHGGRIWVDSRPGLGATFTFTLPAKPGTHGETGEPARR